MNDDVQIDPAAARALQRDVERTHALFGWAVLRDPPDYPGKVIARLVTTEGQRPYVLVSDTLAELQNQLPGGLDRMERRRFDLPELVEIWLSAG